MNWLMELFSDSSDQARAVTTVFVALVALSVVFITQYYNSKRARKEKLIDKLEEIYSLTIRIKDRSDEIGSLIFNDSEQMDINILNEKYNILKKDIDHANMISSLYFSALIKDVVIIKKSSASIYVFYKRFIENDEGSQTDLISVYGQESTIFINSIENLFSEMNRQIKNIMH